MSHPEHASDGELRSVSARWCKELGCALALSVLTLSEPARADSLDLGSVIKIALVRNERAAIAELNAASADAAVARARAAFLPSVGLTGSEVLRPQAVEQDGRVVLRSNAASGSFSISQPILNAGAFPLYASAKHGYEAARYQETDQRRQLAFDAARAFFGVIAAQRVLTAAKSRLDLANATLSDTSARAQAGLTSSNDVTRSQIERASAEQSVANAEGSLEEARINLSYLIANPVDANLTPPGDALALPNTSFSALVNLALANRPDLSSLRAASAAAAASADEPNLRYVPSLSALAQARAQDQPIADSRYVDTTLSLSLNWSIWDGVRGADKASRDAAASAAKLQERALLRRVDADVRAANAELSAARSSLAAAREGDDAARRSADETSVLYKQGLAKAIELVNGNSTKFDSEVAVAAAELALRQAELDMRAALGLFPIDGVK